MNRKYRHLLTVKQKRDYWVLYFLAPCLEMEIEQVKHKAINSVCFVLNGVNYYLLQMSFLCYSDKFFFTICQFFCHAKDSNSVSFISIMAGLYIKIEKKNYNTILLLNIISVIKQNRKTYFIKITQSSRFEQQGGRCSQRNKKMPSPTVCYKMPPPCNSTYIHVLVFIFIHPKYTYMYAAISL